MMEQREKQYIYGIGKVQFDFEYMFEQLPIDVYIVDEDKAVKSWNGRPVINISDIKKENFRSSRIIICDFDYNDKKKILEEKGFVYKDDFIIADDIMQQLDFPVLEKAANRKIVVWGTGYEGNDLWNKEEYSSDIAFWIDSNPSKTGQIFHGKKVVLPSELDKKQWQDIYIIVAIADEKTYYEIRQILLNKGLHEFSDFVWKYFVDLKASDLLRRTMYDKCQYSVTCDTMFNTYEIESTGATCCCCTTFVMERLGNLIYQNFEDIWFSNIHKVLCLSAANKTYTFCKKDMCPVLMIKERKEYVNNLQEVHYKKFGEMPKVMLLSIDSGCNLYCESCRDCVKTLKGEELEKANIMADKILADDNLSNAEFLVMAGNGEVFLSKIYERIWSNEKTKHIKRFRLLSNGTLFNKKRWSDFNKGRASDIMVTFSIDAATKETYSMLRRGGNFDVLLQNLKFAAELRKEQKLKYFQISFVVQRKNYKEMPLFVELGKSLGVDKVFFTRILNWGTYSEDEFSKVSMTDKEGRPNSELLKILNLPVMNEGIVDLGTIVYKPNEKEYDYINNYYLWEIDRYLGEQ